MPSLKNEALAACKSALSRLGFVKRNGALIQDRGEGVSGWIGLNTTARGLPESLKVNPVVGVRFAHLEDVMRTLRDDVPPKPMPIISKPLGYLMPENAFRSWEFVQGGDSGRVAASLADAVKEYGEPYIEKYVDWGKFSHDIQTQGLLMEHDKAKILPVVLALNEDLGAAKGIVESELERVSSLDDTYARSYREFAGKFFGEFVRSV